MDQIPNRRKVSNIIVRPGALWRLSVPFILLVTITVTIVGSIHWRLATTVKSLDPSLDQNLAALQVVNTALNQVTLIGIWGLALMGLICTIMWLRYSHRVLGPSVPIRRHIDNLIKGDYGSRVTLRSGDEFNDIAEDLNLLAEKMAQITKK